MTEYIVMRHEGDGRYLTLSSEHARSAKAAITAYLDKGDPGDEGGGTYVAAPARSWKPVTVKVETKTALHFS